MFAKWLVLPLLFTLGMGLPGCNPPQGEQVASSEKTKAQLLVGRWKRTTSDVGGTSEVTRAFCAKDLSCSEPREEGKRHLPLAPEPRPKKSVSELLIGKWKVVSAKGAIPEADEFTFEFTRDGKLKLRYMSKGRLRLDNTGTYRLNGDLLTKDMPGTLRDAASSIELRIESISQTDLTLMSPPDKNESDQRPSAIVLRRHTAK